uniref:Uncharacterized protein n=1 Tax=Arundo donax TaxID=35708 RepID=A0A0A8ZLA2_ARUDO
MIERECSHQVHLLLGHTRISDSRGSCGLALESFVLVITHHAGGARMMVARRKITPQTAAVT